MYDIRSIRHTMATVRIGAVWAKDDNVLLWVMLFVEAENKLAMHKIIPVARV